MSQSRYLNSFLVLLVASLTSVAGGEDSVVRTKFSVGEVAFDVSGGRRHFIPWMDEKALYMEVDGQVIICNQERVGLQGKHVALSKTKSLKVIKNKKEISILADGKPLLVHATAKESVKPRKPPKNSGGSIVINAGGSVNISSAGSIEGGGVRIGGGKESGVKTSAGGVTIRSGGSIRLGGDINAGGPTTKIKGPLINNGGTMDIGRATIQGDEKYRAKIKFD